MEDDGNGRGIVVDGGREKEIGTVVDPIGLTELILLCVGGSSVLSEPDDGRDSGSEGEL